MPAVSLIIAAYNIENYIDRCLDSIINQSFKDIEIIVVNDGSTDSTLEKINYRVGEDRRIKIIDKNNEGISEARKDGFKQATGEYILFVDGDDYIDKETVKILYSKTIKTNYDIVCFKYIIAFENGKMENQIQPQFDLSGEESFLKVLLTNQIKPSICTKFIKRSFILNNNIPFPENIAFAEDLALSCTLAIYKPKVCLVDEHLYYYYNRDDSVTRKISPKVLETREAFKFIYKELITNNLLDKYIDEYNYLAYIHNYYYRIYYIFEVNNKLNKILYKEWKNMNIEINKNKYYKNLLNKMTFKERFSLKLFEKFYILGRLYYYQSRNA